MTYTCPHCGHKMTALEADAAYDGCGLCRRRIEWEDWLDREEMDELEAEAETERIYNDSKRNKL